MKRKRTVKKAGKRKAATPAKPQGRYKKKAPSRGGYRKGAGRKRGGKNTKRTKNAGLWQPIFLAHFRNHGNIRQACEKAGIVRRTFTYALEHDSDFVEDYKEAQQDAIDILDAHARRESKKPGSKNHRLLMYLLSHLRREVYGDRKEISVKGEMTLKEIILSAGDGENETDAG